MNGILVASYPAYNPLSVYQVTTLTQLQQYSFALSVEVDGLIAQGSALTITTPQGFVVQGETARKEITCSKNKESIQMKMYNNKIPTYPS